VNCIWLEDWSVTSVTMLLQSIRVEVESISDILTLGVIQERPTLHF
jgi:hypothetical protein